MMQVIYQNTGPGCRFRKLFTDASAWILGKAWLEMEGVQECLQKEPEIAMDILLEMSTKAEGGKNPFVHGSAKDYYDAGVIEMENEQSGSAANEAAGKA